MATPCAVKLNQEFPEVTQQQADEILLRIKNLAIEKAKVNGGNMAEALKFSTQAITQQDKLKAALARRNTLFNQQKGNELGDYVQRYPLPGDGFIGKLVGSKYDIVGGRDSVANQMKALHHGYIGRITSELQEAGVFREFRRNEITKEIYQEMGEIRPDGKPGISGNKTAVTIANIIDRVTKELNARLNRAGASIAELPGYVVRQSHDVTKIRAAGDNQANARGAWESFVLPLLDHEKTFLGADKAKFLLNVHNALYSGVHGVMGVEGEGVGHRAIVSKWQQERVLHFKDAESAWAYNQKFGTQDFKEQVLTDISNRTRSIALMENLGPNSEATLLEQVRLARERARVSANAEEQLDSISDVKIMAAYHQLTGINDIPANPTLARTMGNVRAVTQLAKMGGVTLTNLFTDRAFMQAEMAFQGISHLETLGKQITSFASKTADQKKTLHLMGVGIDGFLGNALSRYSATGPVSGPINKFQKIFFDINFSNYVTDTTKSAAAELMAAHLGTHAGDNYTALPSDLLRVLKLYDITAKEWNLLRATAYEHPSGGKMITPDQLGNLSDAQIATLHSGDNAPTAKQLIKLRERLETQLRGYFIDRVDYAIPTPGAAERAIATLDTKAGTPLGEAVRLLMLFKSFPITIGNKLLTREIYGRGNATAKQWLLNDHAGKFHLAQLTAMTIAAGYLGMTIRDTLKGRSPRPLIVDGNINYDVLQDAAVQGGGLGIMGEMITRDYGRGMGSFLETSAGPVLGQLDKLGELKTRASEGEPYGAQLGKMAIDNTPLINLFYIRPILNYYVLWNLQEMMNPGSLKQTEKTVEEKSHQNFFVKPSEVVK